MTSKEPTGRAETSAFQSEPYKSSLITLPNLICIARLLGTLVLIGLALAGWRGWFLALFLFLGLTDLIDGTLARWLGQRSDFGARLDTLADITLISVLIFGVSILCWRQLQFEWAWILMGVSSYLLAVAAGVWKYNRVPSYHTLGAKLGYGLTLLAGVSLLMGWSVWPVRIAAVAVAIANLESIAITCVLNESKADILTLFHAWRNRD
jgi:CDP-diacylglycerol--glycerol-3-phosphate 3-phosphatidyltransferase